jgi:hypothetical protein
MTMTFNHVWKATTNATSCVSRNRPNAPQATKEYLLQYVAAPYWEGKADQLKIPYHLMDLSAPLLPCMTPIVERQIDGMLEDFVDLKEWFFAFKKAPGHKKQTILDGSKDRSYSATLKKRCNGRAIFFALTASYLVAAHPLPLFGPSSKKLKQTTLTQDFNKFLGVEHVKGNNSKALLGLTNKPPQLDKDGKSKAIINLTSRHSESSRRSPTRNTVKAGQHKAASRNLLLEPPSTLEFRFTTPPPHLKIGF